MQTYRSLIQQFLYQQAPLADSKGSRLEAVSALVLGSKQRRFGPMPTPEIQVAIRSIIDEAMARDNVIHFFTPMGAVKQYAGQKLDIAEFMMLRQLLCLKMEVARYGVNSIFHFRLEDLGERWLFGDIRAPEIDAYVSDFTKLAVAVLGFDVNVRLESQLTTWGQWKDLAAKHAVSIHKYLLSRDASHLLSAGWSGTIPQEQVDHYLNIYQKLYPPGHDILWELARYFASARTRVELGAAGLPNVKNIVVAFTHPVPSVTYTNRVYYRTIPQRFTNNHAPPWMTQGYLKIGDDNRVTPKLVMPGDVLELVPNTETVGGVEIAAPYVLG